MLPSPVLTHAPCRDLPAKEKDKIFFVTGNTSPKRARVICKGCMDRTACLDIALSFETEGERYGIWGGLTAPERDDLAAASQMREADVLA